MSVIVSMHHAKKPGGSLLPWPRVAQRRLDPPHRLQYILPAVECRQAEVAFSGGVEAAAGGAHHIGLAEQQIEETPGINLRGRFDPHVGVACSPPNIRSPAVPRSRRC